MNELTENLRKKLTYRSLNRGCRETDILLGDFAIQNIEEMNETELHVYERFLDEYDGDIYKWLTKQSEMPEEYRDNIGRRIMEFCYK